MLSSKINGLVFGGIGKCNFGGILQQLSFFFFIIVNFYALPTLNPNFEKVGRAYCFRLVCLSVCLCVRVYVC